MKILNKININGRKSGQHSNLNNKMTRAFANGLITSQTTNQGTFFCTNYILLIWSSFCSKYYNNETLFLYVCLSVPKCKEFSLFSYIDLLRHQRNMSTQHSETKRSAENCHLFNFTLFDKPSHRSKLVSIHSRTP